MSVEALVEPELLVWARKSAGLDIDSAAKKIQVTAERLESWERGESRPTVKQLRNLGTVYKRPIATFYLPEPPIEFTAMRDFRRLPGVIVEAASPALRLEIRRAQNRRVQALELNELMDIPPIEFSLRVTVSDDPERTARAVREFLGIDYEQQVQWSSDYDSFNHWRLALENAGVMVFQAMGVDIAEMRGFSITDTRLPAIIVNVKDSVPGRIFTMLHELSHIMLGEGGLCDLHEEHAHPSDNGGIEIFCNRLAGAIFLPREELLREEAVASKEEYSYWTDEEIETVSNRYGCSREALLRRLLICGRISDSFYQAKRAELQHEFKNKVSGTGRKGFAPPATVAVSSAGRPFVKLVLNCYQQDKITASDVSSLLDVRLRHLEKIQALVSSSTT